MIALISALPPMLTESIWARTIFRRTARAAEYFATMSSQ